MFHTILTKSTGLLLTLLTSAAAFAAPTPLKLALNWKPEPQFGGFYAATLNGDDLKNDLKFEVLEGGSGTPTIQMLANGKVDLAIVSGEEILIANERNPKNPVVAIFAVYQTSPTMIMCHADRNLSSLKDVYGSEGILALQGGLTYAQFLKRKYPDAKVKTVPYLGGIANYLNDKNYCQQGFVTSEPLLAEKAKQPAKVFMIADEGFNPYNTVVVVREETLRTSPALVKKAVAAIRAGWETYLKDPKATNEHMGKLNKSMDAETFRESAEAQVKLIRTPETAKKGLGTMSAERWGQLASQLVELKVLKTRPKTEAMFQNP